MTNLHYEDSTTVLYFFCFMFGVVLIPITYLLWPANSKKTAIISTEQRCNCNGCISKSKNLFPPTNLKSRCISFANIFILFSLWLIFFCTAYYTLTQEVKYKLYDPWDELGVDRGIILRFIYLYSNRNNPY